MHAVLITAQPGRWQRLVRAVSRGIRRALVDGGLVLLGVVVFALRTNRALSNLAAHHAALVELKAAARAGRQPVGQTIGVAVTAAFVAEFHRARAETPA